MKNPEVCWINGAKKVGKKRQTCVIGGCRPCLPALKSLPRISKRKSRKEGDSTDRVDMDKQHHIVLSRKEGASSASGSASLGTYLGPPHFSLMCNFGRGAITCFENQGHVKRNVTNLAPEPNRTSLRF